MNAARLTDFFSI